MGVDIGESLGAAAGDCCCCCCCCCGGELYE